MKHLIVPRKTLLKLFRASYASAYDNEKNKSENMSTSRSAAKIKKKIYVSKTEMKRFCNNKAALATEPFESSI